MDNPVFDFNQPWVALIQLSLTYFLPRLTGLVSDRLAKSVYKILLLGVLTVVTSAGNFLLAVAVADAWATLDWTALLNVVFNAALTFAIAQGVFQGVIVPTGQAAKDANRGISLIKADPERVADELESIRAASTNTLAARAAAAEIVAKRTAQAVVEEAFATQRAAAAPKAKSSGTAKISPSE